MSKVRIVYKSDETIVEISPAPQGRKEDETMEEFHDRAFTSIMEKMGLAGHDYEDMDIADLPDGLERDKWRGNKQDGIRIDNTIDPPRDKRKRFNALIRAEFLKDTPDLLKIVKLQHKLIDGDYA